MRSHNQSTAPAQPSAVEPRADFTRRMLLTVATITAVGIGLVFLWYAIEVLLVVFAGMLLATVLRSLADLLADYTPIGRHGALALVVLALLAFFGISGWLLAPQVTDQTRQLAEAIPEALAQVQGWIAQFTWGRDLIDQQPAPGDLIGDRATDLLWQATGVFSSTLGVLVELVVILFLGVYLAVDPGKYIRGLIRLVPIPRRPRAREVLDQLGFTLKWFLLGRLLAMIAVGIVTTIGLWLLQVPLALVFGIITTLLTFVPYVGPIVSAILPALVALTVDPMLALYVVLLYVVVQNLEGYLLTPLILQGTVSVPPALTIGAEVLFGVVFGIIGIVLATPFAAVSVLLVKLLYIEDILGDAPDAAPADRHEQPPASVQPT
jgi:predicted PurR-regulated permease PerM